MHAHAHTYVLYCVLGFKKLGAHQPAPGLVQKHSMAFKSVAKLSGIVLE